MRYQNQKTITVAATPEDIRKVVASDAYMRTVWGDDWSDYARTDTPETGLSFACSHRKESDVRLYLRLCGQDAATRVTACIDERFSMVRLPMYLWYLLPGRPGRETRLLAALHRLRGLLETPDWMNGPVDGTAFNSDNLLTLLSVYTTQFGSYTTLLWQVPALGLAAQAFLMTIVLGPLSTSSDGSRYAAAGLSVVIAGASMGLMHTQRGRAITQNELAKRVSRKLSLKDRLGGDFVLDDAVPKIANAETVWMVNHKTYHLWMSCMGLFMLVDAVVILSTVAGWNWFI